MRKLIISLLITLLTFGISAQNHIRGKVINELNEPLAGASVMLKQTRQTVVTNREGEFELTNLSDYAYSVLVKHIGYRNSEKIIQSGTTALIKLETEEVSLDEIIVSATRATDRSPVAFTNVTKEKINERNTGQDLPYLLSLTPSFLVTSDAGTGIGYTGFRIRGTDANRTNITVNGIPLNDSESHSVFFVNMPDFASSLNSVQVQRGVGTSTNGAAAFGASINMQTEVFNPLPYAEAGFSAGSFGTLRNSVKAGTGLINSFAADIRLSGLISDGFIDRASVDMKSYFISAGYYGDNTMVKLITFGGKEKTYQAWNGVDLDNHERTYNELGKYTDAGGKIQFYDNQTDNYNQTHYQLHLTHSFSGQINVNGALHYTRGVGFYEELKERRKYEEYLLTPAVVEGKTMQETDLIRQKWLDNHFGGATFSVNFNKNKLRITLGGGASKYFGKHFGNVIWARQANNLMPQHPYYFSKSTKTDANIFAKINYEIADNLTAFADMQYRYVNLQMRGKDDKFDETTGEMRDLSSPAPFHFLNPKAGLSYRIDHQNLVFASFAIANREPNRNNYTDAGPNDKPTSECLYDTEAGYKFQSSGFSAGANLYYMKYKNQLILNGKISEIGEMLTSNIADSYRAGIELLAGVKILNGLRWDVNLNLSQNKIRNFTEYADQYDADWNFTGTKENFFETTNISYSPDVVANSIVSYNDGNFEVALYSTYAGLQYLDNTSDLNRSIDAYFVNNLRLGYSWKMKRIKSLDFNLLINNLFDTKYETNGYNWYTYYLDGKRINEKRYFPQAGIHFLFSTTIRI